MTLTPQLEPTDLARIERIEARVDRDAAFRDNSLYRHEEPQGTRYTKGNADATPKRSWQSLDAVLRSDANSSEALPVKQLRRSRVFTGLAIASSVLFVAGVAATARDGFSFREVTPGNGVLLGGALGSVAFAVVAGILFRRASKGYDRAVDVYNDSLGLRLGVMTPAGNYKHAADVEIDAEGFVVTEERRGPVYGPAPAPTATTPAPMRSEPTSTTPPTTTPTTTPPPVTPVQPAAPVLPPPGRAQVSAPSSQPFTGLTPGHLVFGRHIPGRHIPGQHIPGQHIPGQIPGHFGSASRLPVGALTLLPQR